MLIVAILTWIAFFCILAELDWKWTYGTHHMWHSILGMIVLVSAFFAVCQYLNLSSDPNLLSSSSHWLVFYVHHFKQNVIVVGIGFIG